jgi:excisionase family DNA binding protein
MEKLLLRPIEAADAIGVGRSQIYQLLKSGQLPSVRIGKSVRVPVNSLRDWIERNRVGDAVDCRS